MRATMSRMTGSSPSSARRRDIRICIAPLTPASGLRTSWATTAAIWPTRASAACWASCSSAALRAVMSARIAMYWYGFPRVVEERHDGRVDPVEVAVLGAVAELAVPDVAVGDRPPELADELLRVIGGVDDPVILPDQLVARIPGDLAELVVDVGDPAGDVGGGDDGRVIERALEVGELLHDRCSTARRSGGRARDGSCPSWLSLRW